MKYPTLLLAMAAAFVVPSVHVQAQTLLFGDTYDYTDGNADYATLDTDQATRESGTFAPITYTDRSAEINGNDQQYLTTTGAYDHATNPADGAADQRALIVGTGGGAISSNTLLLNNDFSSATAGKQWMVSYTGIMTMTYGADPINSWTDSFVLSRNNNGSEADSPNGDFSFSMNYNGTYGVFNGTTALGSGTLTGFAINTPFNLVISLNETGANPTATVRFNSLVLGTFTYNYITSGTGRYINLDNRLYVNSTPATNTFTDYFDTQTNNLNVSVVPEPSATAALLGAAGVGVCLAWGRRRGSVSV